MAILTRACLALATAAIVAACYAPDLRDCTVTCSAGSACADGEVCGSDGFCATPETAGTCNGAHDTVDAAPIPTFTIHIMIAGQGTVVLDGTSTCDTTGSDNGNCMFSVPSHAAANLTAMTTALGHPFMMWTGMGCAGANPVCTFTPTADTMIGAMFK